MQGVKNIQELKSWFDKEYESLKGKYEQRKKSSFNKSIMTEKSIAYHTISEQAIKEGYNLTECQINKLVPLIMG